jgi:hypothetical protein
MANQRHKDKKSLTMWVHKSVREGLEKMGEEQGKPASQVAIDILTAYLLKAKPVAKLAAKKIAKKSTAWDSKKTASQLKRQDVSNRIFQSGESTSSLAS